MKWHEQCVVHFTWARHGRPMTSKWIETVLDRSLDLHAEALIFGIQLGGHVAYESKISPPIADMEIDVLERLCRGGHDRELKIVPYWLTTSGGCAVEATEHPDWFSVDADGELLPHLCYNSPFGEFQEAQVREVLDQYDVDGIFFDQLSAACYCVYCRSGFRAQCDREMPIEAEFGRFPGQAFVHDRPQADLLREFRVSNARRFCRRIRRAIDELRPETVYIQNWLFGAAAEACAEYVDAILPEQHLSTDIDSSAVGNRLVHAYGGKAVWANVSHVYNHHAKVHTAEHTQLLLMQGVAARCSPNVIELNALDDSRDGYEGLRDAMRQVRWASDALKGCEPVKYAAVLHSRVSEQFGGDAFQSSVAGVYDLLAYQHIPFEFVSERSVLEDRLQGFSVLIIPNATHLGTPTLEAIESFVSGGAGLVASYRSGSFDESGGRRENNPILELAGVRAGNEVDWSQDVEYPSVDAQIPIPSVDFRTGRPYFRYVTLPDDSSLRTGIGTRLLSHVGPYIEVEHESGTEVAGQIHDMDQSLVNMRPYNRRGQFPGQPRWPFVTLRADRGRVAYIAGFLEPKRNRAECYEIDRLFANAVMWAGGSPPIAAPSLPPTVHLTLNRSGDGSRTVIVLTNQTTHRIESGSIRYVVPVADLELRINTGGRPVLSATSASGESLALESRDGESVVFLPKLAVADCIVLHHS